MSEGTLINWATDSWNPAVGCAKVSRGCRNCYAARLAATRLAHTKKYEGLATLKPGSAPTWAGTVREVPEDLAVPLTWREATPPRLIFAGSMTDLFHEEVSDKYLLKILTVIANSPYHRYLILTKRPERMFAFMSSVILSRVSGHTKKGRFADLEDLNRRNGPKVMTVEATLGNRDRLDFSHIPNLALGVSIEDEKAVERWEYLRKTPAACRVLSIEPLTGQGVAKALERSFASASTFPDWVIVGGESGPKGQVEPLNFGEVQELSELCFEYDIPYHFKQVGSAVPDYGGRVYPEYWAGFRKESPGFLNPPDLIGNGKVS